MILSINEIRFSNNFYINEEISISHYIIGNVQIITSILFNISVFLFTNVLKVLSENRNNKRDSLDYIIIS
jgi:hypothetical protein